MILLFYSKTFRGKTFPVLLERFLLFSSLFLFFFNFMLYTTSRFKTLDSFL